MFSVGSQYPFGQLVLVQSDGQLCTVSEGSQMRLPHVFDLQSDGQLVRVSPKALSQTPLPQWQSDMHTAEFSFASQMPSGQLLRLQSFAQLSAFS